MAELAPQVRFSMQSCRSAIASGLDHISRHVSALEDAISREPGLAFDLSKVLVESVCKKLLTDLGIPFADDDELPKLYKVVTTNVPILPTSASSEAAARESVKRPWAASLLRWLRSVNCAMPMDLHPMVLLRSGQRWRARKPCWQRKPPMQ